MRISRYRSYFMRVWTSTGPDGPQWVGRVECIQDGARQFRFNDLDALLSYLRSTLREGPAAPNAKDHHAQPGNPGKE